MNTGKQVNAMVVVLFLLLIAVGVYTIWDPFRSDDAELDQLETTADRGAETFALNCRLCHGDRGEGGSDGGRLPAAAVLDRDDLQGFENGTFSEAIFKENFQFVGDTIMCGRVGTAMPTWGESQGGTLNDEQIRQLTVLITAGDSAQEVYSTEGFWDLAQEHADVIDAEATGHAEVEDPGGTFGAGSRELVVNNAGPFALGQYVRIEDERLRVLPRALEVERGVDGTEAGDHDAGVEIVTDVSEGDEPDTLSEAVDDEVVFLVVDEPDAYAAGDTLQIDDEVVEVIGIVTGLPTTDQVLIADTGFEPNEFLVSGSDGLAVGDVVRLDGELVKIVAIADDGDLEIALDADVSSDDVRISVDKPVFFREGYTFRVGDEVMTVVGAVDTGQLLSETVGRAESTIALSGTAGIEEGMVIRLGEELLRIVEIVEPATVKIDRGQNDTEAASHTGGTQFFRPPEEPAEGEEAEETEDEPVGQTLLEAIGDDDDTIVVTSTTGFSVGETYRIGDELVTVTESQPARVKVERAVGDTSVDAHARRSPVFEGNLLQVERGDNASPHSAGDSLFVTEIEVDRAVELSELEEHSKGAEIFQGNSLIVQRGALDTEPADHANGLTVLDFPTAPDVPSITGEACGQKPLDGGPTTDAPPPIPGAAQIAVSLDEWEVVPDPDSGSAGPFQFDLTNDGTLLHNFLVIATDLPADGLPVSDNAVVEDEVNVIGGVPGGVAVAGTNFAVIANMPPGSYVLICNIPGHYENGMFIDFEVTAAAGAP